MLLESFQLRLVKLLLLNEFILEHLVLLKLGVVLELDIATDKPSAPNFILELLVFNLELDHLCRIKLPLLDSLFQLRLSPVKLPLCCLTVLFVVVPILG